jgi:Rrf2 family protein
MIRVSKKADYAVFIMGYLARQLGYATPGGPGAAEATRVVSAHEIATHSGLNQSMVANLLKDLTRGGVLESVRGVRGGYRLAKPFGEISLKEILESIEGPVVLVDCASDLAARGGDERSDPLCSLTCLCASRTPMRAVHARIARLLADIKLPELCGTPLDHAAPFHLSEIER